MMRRAAIDIPSQRIAEFCRRWRIGELSLFGSVLRDDFDCRSDVDVMVRFDPDAAWGLLEHGRMQEELGELLGRRVHLVTRRSVEASDNWVRKRAILESAEPVYVAR